MNNSKYKVDDSDSEVQEGFYFPRKQNTRMNAVKALRVQRENDYVESMLGLMKDEADMEELNTPPPKPKRIINPCQMATDSIRLWRRERLLLTSSITNYMKQKRACYPGSRTELDNVTNYGLREVQSSSRKLKYRPEPNAAELNKFLSSLQSQFQLQGAAGNDGENSGSDSGDTLHQFEKECHNENENEGDTRIVTRRKFEMKEEDILRRPSQLVKMKEVDAGTERDELRDARKDVLKKLSKQCAYWMVHKNTPWEDREDLNEKLVEAHGYYGEDEIDNNLYDMSSKFNKRSAPMGLDLDLGHFVYDATGSSKRAIEYRRPVEDGTDLEDSSDIDSVQHAFHF